MRKFFVWLFCRVFGHNYNKVEEEFNGRPEHTHSYCVFCGNVTYPFTPAGRRKHFTDAYGKFVTDWPELY